MLFGGLDSGLDSDSCFLGDFKQRGSFERLTFGCSLGYGNMTYSQIICSFSKWLWVSLAP